jgi:hypothetical protein
MYAPKQLVPRHILISLFRTLVCEKDALMCGKRHIPVQVHTMIYTAGNSTLHIVNGLLT